MISTIGSAASNKVVQRFTAPSGMSAGLAAISAGPPSGLTLPDIRVQNVAADLAERTNTVKYPLIQVYCDKISNDLTEKFRRFSGRVQMAMELRHSQDRLDGLQDALELYVDAATQVLDSNRGDWGDGMFYAGAYQVTFGAVKQGGRNFIQVAKVTFEIGVSRN
jgi:hypothetical protein